MGKIKVLVVDDSALMRKIISDMVNSTGDMEVISTCRNGEEFLEKLKTIKPDVVTLDIEMPKMDGITALRQLKAEKYDIPVIVLSSGSRQSASVTMECLEAGAFDFLSKPSGAISLDIEKVKNELILKIRAAASKNVTAIKKENVVFKKTLQNDNIQVRGKEISAVVIGASTGGPKALYSVITKLSNALEVPVLVVQHMPAGFTKAFAERLNGASKLKVIEAYEGVAVEKNVVYVAPGGYHMIIGADKKIHLNDGPPIWGVKPAVDKLFISASAVFSSHLLSVILTGMGRDGAAGTIEIKNSGGITISEDESTCTIYGMPKAAYETGKVDMVLPLHNIAAEIENLVSNSRR